MKLWGFSKGPITEGYRQMERETRFDGKTPRDFLKSFYYDTCVYDPRVLEALISLVGTERLVMGSDYPVGEKTPVQWLQQAGLEGEALAAVAGGNAANLLGL
jgi:aminocarboxymuconate-semialdehyde decarboxylase